MAKAKKLPSGNWKIQPQANGKRMSFTALTKKEAELMAAEWINGLTKVKDERTVGDCIDDYIASKEHILSPTTIAGYRQIKKNDLMPLCDTAVGDIDQMTVQKLMNQISLRKSAKSVKNAHGLLSAVLNVYAPEIRLRTTLPKPQKQIKHLPPAEQVIDAIMGTDIELPCLLAVWEGMRLSEIRGLKKSDIKDGILEIHETIVTVERKDIVKEQTKTYDSTRIMSLSPYLLDLIAQLPPDQEHLTTLSGRAIYKRFVRILEKNGIPHMKFHDLRHLNASTMLALNIPDKYAMERGGWSSTSVIKSVYQHTLTEERKAVDKTVDDYFENIIKKCARKRTQDKSDSEK